MTNKLTIPFLICSLAVIICMASLSLIHYLSNGSAKNNRNTLTNSDSGAVSLSAEIRKLQLAALADPQEAAPQLSLAKALVKETHEKSDPSLLALALRSFEQVMELKPGDSRALLGLANVHYDMQNWSESLYFYKQYLDQHPQHLNVKNDYATVQLNAGLIDQAIITLNEIIEKDAKHHPAQMNLALAYLQQNSPQKARTHAKMALLAAPSEQTRESARELIERLN